MAATGHGATFTFTCDKGNFSGGVTKINVDTPTAEVADMTAASDSADSLMLVPTGSWRGGSIAVDFIGSYDPQPLVGGYGSLSFASSGFGVERQVILESSSSVASVGDVVRGSLKFLMTDYYG